MRFIPTRIHGMLDYITGIFLIVAPWLFDFANGSAAQWVLVIAGVALLGVSMITSYEMGIAAMIPVRTHLNLDIVMGIFLLISPWLFGFAEVIIWPYVIVGLLEIGAGLFTDTAPSASRANVA